MGPGQNFPVEIKKQGFFKNLFYPLRMKIVLPASEPLNLDVFTVADKCNKGTSGCCGWEQQTRGTKRTFQKYILVFKNNHSVSHK